MNRQEMREIIQRVLEQVQARESSEPQLPAAACVFGDGGPCDATTLYAVGEEG